MANPQPQGFYPGTLMGAGQSITPPQSQSYTCLCGSPATNVCENNLLCSGCFFKYSVAKAAGKADEFWAGIHEIQARRVEESRKQQEKIFQEYYATAQQNSYPPWAQAQQAQNWGALQGMGPPSEYWPPEPKNQAMDWLHKFKDKFYGRTDTDK
jgi:hypothetical protein